MHFFAGARSFFRSGEPSKSLYFLRKAYVFKDLCFFRFAFFWPNELQKSCWKPIAGTALKKFAPGSSWEPFWDPKSIQVVRATPEKSKKTPKKVVSGGSRFLTIFSIASFIIFWAKMGENHRYGWACFRKKIEKNVHLLLRWCSGLLPGASGHVFRRFWVWLGMIFDSFGTIAGVRFLDRNA